MPRETAKLVTIYWRDIPAQINAQQGRTREQVLLPRRFQRAIDQAAMHAGLSTAQSYVAEWRRTAEACGDDLAAAAAQRAADTDAAYPKERLDRIANAGGLDPDGHTRDTAGPDRER